MTTTRSPTIIEPIINRNFGNIFHNENVPNQHQLVNKTQVNIINTYPSTDQINSRLHT